VATNNTLIGADRGIYGSEAVMVNPDFRYALGANCFASYNRNRQRYAHHGKGRLRESNWLRPPSHPTHRIVAAYALACFSIASNFTSIMPGQALM
jgi:hypothetical protein